MSKSFTSEEAAESDDDDIVEASPLPRAHAIT
jgi:hypothetical protein